MKKILLTVMLAAGGFIGASITAGAQQYIYVQTAPPPPPAETEPAMPGPGYVWVGGYYQWNGDDYVWVPGHFVQHAGTWCAGQWRHDEQQGWYFVPGHWC
jgi:hypothetical protein